MDDSTKWYDKNHSNDPSALQGRNESGQFTDDTLGNFEIEDDIIGFLRENNFKYVSADAFNAKTDHGFNNNLILNKFLEKRFQPLTKISDEEFENKKRECVERYLADDMYEPTEQQYVYVGRGVRSNEQMGLSAEDVVRIYFGENDTDLYVPWGVLGSAIYTGYEIDRETGTNKCIDYYTKHDSFSSQVSDSDKNVGLEMIIDNSKCNIISKTEYNKLREELRNNLPNIEQNVVKNLKGRGYDDQETKKIWNCLFSTLANDPTGLGILMGLDGIYDENKQYALMFNFNGIYAKEGWSKNDGR